MQTTQIQVEPVAGSLGAEIRGVDLSSIDDSTFEQVHQAFLDHAVIFFRDQTLEPEQQKTFARRFGELDVHPIVNAMEGLPEVIRVLKPAGQSASFGTGWHSDNSFFSEPSLGSVLYGVEIPPHGGDTLFASVEKAYEALSDSMKSFLADKVAVHSASRAYDPAITGEAKYEGDAPITYRYSEAVREEHEHPVIRTHPETGRKSIFVNAMFTQCIVGLKDAESSTLLDMLYRHCTRPDFTCRFRWTTGAVAVWDNRCVQHYALDDYQRFERVMHRVTISGDRPA